MYKALGVHCFASGLLGGVQKVIPIAGQLECHGFGLETARQIWNIDPVINCPASDWPLIKADIVFSNCRCTAWSCTTAGYSSDGHGPLAKQCADTLQLFEYAMGQFPIIVLESVNQAYSTGKPLFDEITARALTYGYRVAHVFVNAATFNICQQRKRYFYILYPGDKKFNVSLPDIYPYYPVLHDVIGDQADRQTSEWDRRSPDYTRDSYARLNPDDMHAIPSLPTGWSLNTLAQYDYEKCTERQRRKWDERMSSMPFSMHSITRLSWLRPCPTLQSSSTRLVHPWHHRTLTVGELSMVMGWGDKIPVGLNPCAQLAKGVCPSVGEWIAEQCLSCLEDEWNNEEWTTRYNPKSGVFEGEDSSQMNEKVIDVSNYVGQQFDVERYPEKILKQFHRFNICGSTGKLLKPWRDVPKKGYLL